MKSVQRAYKFRLYPNSEQTKKLYQTIGVCRWLYNNMIEKINKEGLQTRNDLNYYLTELKESESWLYSYHSKMLQMVSTQIDSAQKALVQLRKNGHKTGKLRFVKFTKYNTFVYNQSGFKIEYGYLHLSKIGKIKIIQHRQIPENHIIKQITITKAGSGKWYACIIAEIESEIPKVSLSRSVGIDVGIKNFSYDSAGFATSNPLHLQKMLKKLRHAQRKISRRQKNSNNRKKAIKFYQLLHERIRNRRKDFHHKLSTQYSRKYDIVFVEKLAKLNMVKNKRMARNILDSSWSRFTNMLDYKTMVVYVPPRNTTIECSRCSNLVPKSLSVRTHNCDNCGLVLDRDHNVAINILKKGLGIFNFKLPQELRKVTPVEILSRSRKQETTVLCGSSQLSSSG